MQVLDRKESKLLGRTEIRVLFGEKAGALPRQDAVRMVAEDLKVNPSIVGLVALKTQSGTRNLVGIFHVYNSDEKMKAIHHKHLLQRLLSKEERAALKKAKKAKKSEKPQAK